MRPRTDHNRRRKAKAMARPTPGGVAALLSYFTRHKTIANLLLVVMLIMGAISLPGMRSQFFPDVVVDTITVQTTWDGASAEDVDEGIVQILDPVLLAVEGVESSSARSVEGRASIELDFEPGWEMGRASEDVLAALNRVTTLPEDAEEPTVIRGAWRDRVTDVVVTGPVSPEQLALVADELVLRLFDAGVTRTTIRGVASPLTVVEVPSVNLIAHDITMSEIAIAVAAQVAANPAGDLEGANIRVRTGTRDRDAASIEEIVLRSNQDGTKLTVGDISTVNTESVARERQYFIDKTPAMSIRVDRSAAGDALDVQERVEETVRALRVSLPEGIKVDLVRTRSAIISDRLNLLVDNGLVGLSLVLILLFLFLNARTAFWVAAGIPVALMGAITVMYLLGLTINMISLFALIITLGIIVDDAIVVGEHADARYRKLREPPVLAAERAAQRMALPVFCATLTTMIAFFGLVVIGGDFGAFIADMPWTVVAVLVASLIECFLILPHHMAHALTYAAKERWYDKPSVMVNRGFVWVRERFFRPFTRVVITFRYPVLAAIIALLLGQVSMLISRDVSWRFFNAPELSSVTGNFMMSSSATREDTRAMMEEMQRATEEVGAMFEERHGVNPLDFVMAEIGGNAGRGISGSDTKSPDQLGGISIELIDADLRPYSSFAFSRELQQAIIRHPQVEAISFRNWSAGPGDDGLKVELYGASATTLKQASEAIQTALAQFPDVTGVEDNLAYDKEELVLTLTPQGQALGFSIDRLGQVIRHRLSGLEAATYPQGPRTAEIRIEIPRHEATADFVEAMQLRAPTGAYVPLGDIVNVDRRAGFSTVRRENGTLQVNVTGEIAQDDAERAFEVMTLIEKQILPEVAAEYQVETRITGLAQQERAFLGDAQFSLMLTLAGIYMVLAWVFASWSRPMVVMAIIPFGLTGAIFGHYIWDVPMSMFTIIGLLGMTGIIINDSIVLVTTIDEHAENRGIVEAIVEGTADRLRPVMLTTLTTVLGLTPLLFENSQQAQFLKPSVITLVYGLGFGMVLVLMLVPCLIAIQHDLSRRRQALRRALITRGKAIRVPVTLGFLAMLGWLGATLGTTAITGALPLWITGLVPELATWSAMAAAFALYTAGLVVVLLIIAVAVVLAKRPSARAA